MVLPPATRFLPFALFLLNSPHRNYPPLLPPAYLPPQLLHSFILLPFSPLLLPLLVSTPPELEE